MPCVTKISSPTRWMRTASKHAIIASPSVRALLLPAAARRSSPECSIGRGPSTSGYGLLLYGLCGHTAYRRQGSSEPGVGASRTPQPEPWPADRRLQPTRPLVDYLVRQSHPGAAGPRLRVLVPCGGQRVRAPAGRAAALRLYGPLTDMPHSTKQPDALGDP